MNCNIDRKRTMETASNNTWESKTATKRSLPRPTPKFTVVYVSLSDQSSLYVSIRMNCSVFRALCVFVSHTMRKSLYVLLLFDCYSQSRLCDGGAQEMSTAVTCVREIFPDASISTHRRTSEEDVRLGTSNPEVVIRSNTGEIIWSSKQKNLYQKYPKKRKKSMKEIKKALEALKSSTDNLLVVSSATAATTTTTSSSSSSSSSIIATSSSHSSTPEATSVPTVVNEVSEDFTTADVPPADEQDDNEEGFCCAYPLR